MAAVFVGTHFPKLDEKGRLFLPAKFREQLAGGLVMTKGQDRCLYVFADEQFAVFGERIQQASLSAKAVRDYVRVFFAGASFEVPDKQGRVTLPTALREYAGLDRDIAVIGASNHVEIWDAPAWQAFLATSEQSFADLSEEVLPGLF